MRYLIISAFLLLANLSIAKNIETSILIKANAEKVWAVFANFGSYPNWNPFIKLIEGEVAVHNKIRVQIKAPGTKATTFKAKVLLLEPNRRLKWRGRLLLPLLFDGVHQFSLIDNGDGTTTFMQSENFKGILVPFFKKRLEVNTKEGFSLRNKRLKELAEQ